MECMFRHNCFCPYIPDFHSPIIGAGGAEVVLTRVMTKREARHLFRVSHQLAYDLSKTRLQVKELSKIPASIFTVVGDCGLTYSME